MISLLQTVTEMERLEELRSSTAEAYRLAILSVAQYAVEVEAQEAAAFRRDLETLARQFERTAGPGEIRQIQSSFRGELRDYQERANLRIEAQKRQIDAGAAAMQALAGSLAESGADHEAQVRREMEHLRKIAGWSNLTEIRRGIAGVITGFSEALEKMQRSNQMAILQLQDEIRTLHQDMEASKRAATIDPATGAWNRQKSDQRLQELLSGSEAFVVLLIAVKNFQTLPGRFPGSVIEGALKAVTKRLGALTGEQVARRSCGEFVVFMDVDPAAAMAISREAAGKLTGPYPIQEAGAAVTVPIEVATGVVERRGGMDAAAFVTKLEQLSATLQKG